MKRSWTGLVWVGLSCDADGQTEQRGSQPGQESKDSHSDSVHGEQTESIHPSCATVWCVVQVLIFSCSRRSCWRCSFHSLFQREATQSLKEIPEKGKESREHSAWLHVCCLMCSFYLIFCAAETETQHWLLLYAKSKIATVWMHSGKQTWIHEKACKEALLVSYCFAIALWY